MRRSFARCGLALVAAVCLVGGASGFGTINWLGQHAEHERITRWALESAGFGPETLDALAGAKGSFGAVGAPDRPGRGLVDVKDAHCDGGDWLDVAGYPHDRADAQARLEACRAWMFANLDRAVEDAAGLVRPEAAESVSSCRFDGKRQGIAKCLVLEDLGLALHASEDFYAHTNWVDRPAAGAIGPENPPGLGNPGPSPWIDPRRRSEPFPSGLISGCYDGSPEPLHCGAGGSNPRVAHRVLNKDEGVIDPAAHTVQPGETPRGRVEGNFERAVNAAVADTRDKWAYFQERIQSVYGDRAPGILCRLRSDQPGAC